MASNHIRQEGTRARARVIGIVFIFALIFIFGTYLSLSVTQSGFETFKPVCEDQLAASIGYTESGTCLESINITVSTSNSSENYVPVLIIQPGTVAKITFLFHDVVPSLIVPSEGAKPMPPNLTAAEVPSALSVSTGKISDRGVVFSNASLIFQHDSWFLYTYLLSSSSNSSGYYAILPPFYYGMYPALYVGNPNTLNFTELSMWAYDGPSISSEHTIPSNIVGTSDNVIIVNASISAISYCPNAACVLISHSGY